MASLHGPERVARRRWELDVDGITWSHGAVDGDHAHHAGESEELAGWISCERTAAT